VVELDTLLFNVGLLEPTALSIASALRRLLRLSCSPVVGPPSSPLIDLCFGQSVPSVYGRRRLELDAFCVGPLEPTLVPLNRLLSFFF
jgi:hypothetical protein